MKKVVSALTLSLLIGSGTCFAAASQQDAAAAIMDAVKTNLEADKMGYEWRDTYKSLLGPAKQAYQKGEYDKAVELAKTAKEHAQLGIEQAQKNANADLRNN